MRLLTLSRRDLLVRILLHALASSRLLDAVCLRRQACGDLYHEIGKSPSARLVGVTLVQVLTLADGVYLYHLDCVDDTQ